MIRIKAQNKNLDKDRYCAGAPFATTVNYMDSAHFAARARLIKRPPPGKVTDALDIIRRILRAARREHFLLLTSSWGRIHPDLLAAVIMGFWPERVRPIIVMRGCMWEPSNGLRAPIERIIVKLADRAIARYIVQSSEELTIFPDVWGIDRAKVRFCPFFFSLTREDLANSAGYTNSDHIFAGGNSHRDYEPLLAAARQMPERRFILATHLLQHGDDIPPNVWAGPVSHRDYISLMRSATATAVPIRQGLHRAAGQQTYLNAMWLKKPTVVTDTLGVRDYIHNGKTGLIVDGSPESYVEALRWIFNPYNREAVERLRANAHKVVQEQFSFKRHIHRLLAIVDETMYEMKRDDGVQRLRGS